MILLIDTSQETGFAAIANEGEILFSEENKTAKEHASWLHMAIGRILSNAGLTMRDLKAVAVVAGPGSYTGLRVGMAAAKGFCYALKIPLITQNTLRVMAESMIPFAHENRTLICPMIDARRDEVFTALYTLNAERETLNEELSTANCQPSTIHELNEKMAPKALILDKTAFEKELTDARIVFFGSGAEKWKKMADSPNALFHMQPDLLQSFATLAWHDFTAKNWADTVYSEPVYLKEFFSY